MFVVYLFFLPLLHSLPSPNLFDAVNEKLFANSNYVKRMRSLWNNKRRKREKKNFENKVKMTWITSKSIPPIIHGTDWWVVVRKNQNTFNHYWYFWLRHTYIIWQITILSYCDDSVSIIWTRVRVSVFEYLCCFTKIQVPNRSIVHALQPWN